MKRQKFFLTLIFVSLIFNIYGQKSTNTFFSPTKIGIQFSQGNENNFLFDDPDYLYITNILKGQLFFFLKKTKSFEISLIVQPQIQYIQHQLHNKYFVKSDEPNYLEKRQRFTKLKNLSITAIEFAIEAKKQLHKNISFFFQASLGFGYIDTETERLAKGFTFLENGLLGLDFKLTPKFSIQSFGGVGHVSNFNLLSPNNGYTIFSAGVGLQYSLK